MIVDIDINTLIREKLTPNQLFILQLLMEGQYSMLKEWYTSLDDSSVIRDLHKLIELEFIINTDVSDDVNFSRFAVLAKGIKLLGMDRDWFQELVDNYPVKTIRSDGTKDYLRTDLERCRKIYQRVTNGNLSKHEEILDCLTYELSIRESEGSMPYMKRLPKWLASEEWKAYKERMNDEENGEIDNVYGTELL